MTAPKCHTQMQSSMRFRDFQILSQLVYHIKSSKTHCSEGTCSPRWDQLWFLIDTPWVSSTLLITNLTLCFPCILFYLGTDSFSYESQGRIISLYLVMSPRTLRCTPSWVQLSMTHSTLNNQTVSILTTSWMPMGHWRKVKLFCPSQQVRQTCYSFPRH